MAANARSAARAGGSVIRGILTNSPLSLLGYAYATLVGMVWGFIWSTGNVERRGGLFIFRGMPSWTFGRGGSCVGACYLTRTNVSPDVLEHEAVHKQQWRTFGLLFPVLYALEGFNPLTNRFEIEAGLEKGGYLRRRQRAPLRH
ncbi:Fe-S oxidoreductase [Paramicrobacterium chengjingii]|uniref:Fe-S oxidoreductase n=1 Tax=Paramicrobacterium chengjingii TaxID=2769067 RepID=A0ABX6YFS8_9MICO|nr:Fe-S oxidoreductase [Microbacterium chengjingii]QPZ37260.1 Fe-S oxidoreductase [Microbacterium chengjingii]